MNHGEVTGNGGSRYSEAWPSPPHSANTSKPTSPQGSLSRPQDQVTEVCVEDEARDGLGQAYPRAATPSSMLRGSRNELRPPNKPAPPPPLSNSSSPPPSHLSPLNNPSFSPYGTTSRRLRQYSADNLLEAQGITRDSSQNMGYSTVGRPRLGSQPIYGASAFGENGGGPASTGFTTPNQGFPRGVTSASFNRAQNFLNTQHMAVPKPPSVISEEDSTGASAGHFCKAGTGKFGSLIYLAFLVILSCNVHMMPYYRPEIVQEMHVEIFSLAQFMLGIGGLMYLMILCRHIKSLQKLSPRDDRHASVYLRFGLVFFGSLSALNFVFKLMVCLSRLLSTDCLSETIMPALLSIFSLLFCYMQIFILVTHSKLCISESSNCARLALAQVSFVTIYFGLRALLDHATANIPVSKYLVHSYGQITANSSNSSNISFTPQVNEDCIGDSLTKSLEELYSEISPYLFLSLLHFSLIATAFNISMWLSVKKRKRFAQNFFHALGHKARIFSCRNTSVGLLFGVINMGCASTIVFLLSAFQMSEWLVSLYHIYTSMLYCIMTAACIKSLVVMKSRQAKSWNHNRLDKPLLIFSFSAVLLFCVLGTLSSIQYTLKDDDGSLSYSASLAVVSFILNAFQSSLQVVFLLDGLRRVANRHKSSSRGLTVLLALFNLTLWALQVLEYAVPPPRARLSAVRFATSDLVKVAILASNSLAIYFRFHSAACFLDVWQFSYD